MNLETTIWLDTLDREYLRDFLPHGGSAVKFPICSDPTAADGARDEVRRLSSEAGLVFLELDAAHTRIHLIQEIFFAVSRKLDWQDLARRFVRGLLRGHGLTLPPEAEELSFATIAAANRREEVLLQGQITTWIEEGILGETRLCQEFRYAMSFLCESELDPVRRGSAQVEAIERWCRGELDLVSAIKQIRIFQKIGRHNARDMFFSLVRWLWMCELRGLVLWVDFAQLFEPKPAERPEGVNFYTPASILDAYEVFRQFIDGIGDGEHCLISLCGPRAFLTDPKVGVHAYQALQSRICDDVHDRRRANPLAALARLGAESDTEPYAVLATSVERTVTAP